MQNLTTLLEKYQTVQDADKQELEEIQTAMFQAINENDGKAPVQSTNYRVLMNKRGKLEGALKARAEVIEDLRSIARQLAADLNKQLER